LKLDASFTSLTIGIGVEDPAGSRHLNDALEGRTVGLSQWLMESDAVSALLLAPDGTIRARNRAAGQIFPHDPAEVFGSSVWDYLVCSEAAVLRHRLLEPGGPGEICLRLNLTDEMQRPITLEAGLVRCGRATLLLATRESRDASRLASEITRLTNELSTMARKAARK
jgi:PAS domain-containing protein